MKEKMIKYIGGALIVACGWLIGRSLYSIYSDRKKIIERIESFVLFCESEIVYGKTEFLQIIDKFKQNENKFDKYIFRTENNSFYLTKETKDFLQDFTEKITSLDFETQKKYFVEAKQKIKNLEEKAEKDVLLKGRIFKRLLPVIAIGIFILLL